VLELLLEIENFEIWSSIQPSVLNADLKATMNIRITRICCVIFESILYFEALLFHYPKISNLSSLVS